MLKPQSTGNRTEPLLFQYDKKSFSKRQKIPKQTEKTDKPRLKAGTLKLHRPRQHYKKRFSLTTDVLATSALQVPHYVPENQAMQETAS